MDFHPPPSHVPTDPTNTTSLPSASTNISSSSSSTTITSNTSPATLSLVHEILQSVRADYNSHTLHERDIEKDPFIQFTKWFNRAQEDKRVFEPNGMVLSTCTPDGLPSSRVVLLRGVDHRCFTFYTNYTSRKGRELAANPNVCITFWWLECSVRIEGVAERVTPDESDGYFRTRPRASQIGAWASEQSKTIDSREVLEQKVLEFAQLYEGKEVPRPDFWGGFRVVPNTFEFWQGRTSRLHDRLRFTKLHHEGSGGSEHTNLWKLERLSP